MKIFCSAVMFQEYDSSYWNIITGKRHCDCFEKMFHYGVKSQYHIEGFLTDSNQFVDRYDGAQIAYQAKQITEPLNILYSEDIWPD